MRLEQLEHLVAVTQHGSLRRASERLHISQPALSESLRKLERELAVTLLDRKRSGARISRRGRELLQNMVDVLESVDRLRLAAGDQTSAARLVRLGTVNGGTTAVLLPALRAFRRDHPNVTVEVVTMQQAEIHVALAEGSLDLGLVNLLGGDDVPPEVVSIDLLHGRPVVVLPHDHPLSDGESVTLDELRAQPFITMRSGYLMHRFVHRLFGSDMPTSTHTTDGAELGKVMVAEGLGLTVLPDYSVAGDPFERLGLITTRPLAGVQAPVTLALQTQRGGHAPSAVRDLVETLVAQARNVGQGTARRTPPS